MKFQRLALIAIALFFFPFSQILSQPANIEVRVEGVGVSPDTINGLQAMVRVETRVRITWSAQSAVTQGAATIPFEISSPTNPDMYMDWLIAGAGYGTSIVLLNGWETSLVWSLAGTVVSTSSDGLLPDSFLVGGAAITGGFQSDELLDVFMTEVRFNDTGVVCIDSAFMPPSGAWLMGVDPPTWGGTPSGYPDGGYCITVYQPGCCTTPGDANGDASVNISDLTYIIARIFSGGPAPVCENEGDANGDQSLNIADAAFLVSRIFGGGPAPRCWWQTDPNAPFEFTFFGAPDTISVSPCGSFSNPLFVQVNNPFQPDNSIQFTMVDASSGITATFAGVGAANSDSLLISGTINSGEDEFVIIRATSVQFPAIQTDKIILITCP